MLLGTNVGLLSFASNKVTSTVVKGSLKKRHFLKIFFFLIYESFVRIKSARKNKLVRVDQEEKST